LEKNRRRVSQKEGAEASAQVDFRLRVRVAVAWVTVSPKQFQAPFSGAGEIVALLVSRKNTVIYMPLRAKSG
jgi:hypothetical protein